MLPILLPDGDPGANADDHVRTGSGRIDEIDAMTEDEWLHALTVGKRYADKVADQGADIAAVGNVGAGGQTAAAAMIGSLTTTEPVCLVPRWTPTGQWQRETAIIRDAMFRARDVRRDPVEVSRIVGSPDIVATIGFLAQSAVRRTPVIIDGVIGAAAALCADQMAPGARQWWIAGAVSSHPAQALAFRNMDIAPLLDVGMMVEEACGATLAMPLVAVAVDIAAQGQRGL